VEGLGRLGLASDLSLPEQVPSQPGLDRALRPPQYTVFCIFRYRPFPRSTHEDLEKQMNGIENQIKERETGRTR